MDSPQHTLPTLTISLPEKVNEAKSLRMSIRWEKGTNPDTILALSVVAMYEDMSDLIVQSIHDYGVAIDDVATSQIVIDKILKAKVALDKLYQTSASAKNLVVDPEDIFKISNRPTL